jgi:zinc transporter ZupT
MDSGFGYTWEELQPIRATVVTMIVAQLLGAVVGLVALRAFGWFERVCIGAALATAPGFLLGVFIQARLEPGSLGRNRKMVFFCGAIGAIMSLIAYFVPPGGLQG